MSASLRALSFFLIALFSLAQGGAFPIGAEPGSPRLSTAAPGEKAVPPPAAESASAQRVAAGTREGSAKVILAVATAAAGTALRDPLQRRTARAVPKATASGSHAPRSPHQARAPPAGRLLS